MKNRLALPVKIVVSGGLLYMLFRKIDISAFWSVVASANYLTVLIIFFFFLGIQTLSTIRWHIIIKKDIKVSFSRLFSFYFIGMFFNNFLPTIVGGDIVKLYYLSRISGKGGTSMASIFLDRYSGFAALMAITSVSLIVGYRLIEGTPIPFLLFILIGAFSIISLAIWFDKFHGWAIRLLAGIKLFGINEKIDKFYNALMSYKGSYAILIHVFGISLFVQAGNIVAYFILARTMNIDVSIGYFFLFVPLATTIAMLPFSLSGLGLREGAFVFLFSRAGVASTEALSLSLLYFFIIVATSLIGGPLYIWSGTEKSYKVGMRNAIGK